MKKLNLEKLLFIFIVILPILDMSSFLFRNLCGSSFSPSTFIRPVIPILVILVIFFTNNNKFKISFIFICLIYALYALAHLYFFNKLHTQSSFGTLMHEMQYLINYSFGILNLFIFLFVFKNENSSKHIKIGFLILNGIYISSLYISIVTHTSSTTYIEGMGYKGWFESGNSLSAILIFNLFMIFTLFNKLETKFLKICSLVESLLSGVFLSFLLGTRTGLFGFILVTCLFIGSKLLIYLRNYMQNTKSKLFTKTSLLLILVFLLTAIAIVFVLCKNDSLLARRKYLKNLSNNLIDPSTGEPSHVTGDVLNFKNQIEQNLMLENYMSTPMQMSIIELYNFANNYKISGTSRRIQQLAYNAFLVKNQSNCLYIIFGNGFLNNYAELTLEMELPALLFNFGILGFILYFMPFACLFFYYIYIGIKNIKYIDAEYIFLVFGILLSFALSFLLGQIFFNSSASIVIVCMNVLLYNKCRQIKHDITSIPLYSSKSKKELIVIK